MTAPTPPKPKPPSAVAVPKPPPMSIGQRGIEIHTSEDLMRLAGWALTSGFVPVSFKAKEQVAIAMQMGLEAGITPLAALRAIYVVGNRPSWMTSAAVALCRDRGVLVSSPTRTYGGAIDTTKQGLDRYADGFACTVTMQRVGDPSPQSFSFSVADAKEAGLWKKPGPWSTSPKVMLYRRALGQGLDLLFSDVLLGLGLKEIEEDIPDAERFERAREVNPHPAPAMPAQKLPDPILQAFEDDLAALERELAPDPEAVELEVVPDDEATPNPFDDPPPVAPPPPAQPKPQVAKPKATPKPKPAAPQPPPEQPELAPAGGPTCPSSPDGEHAWVFTGDPLKEEEPEAACSYCGTAG